MHMGTGEVQGVIGRHGWMLSPQHSSRHMASVLVAPVLVAPVLAASVLAASVLAASVLAASR